MKLLHYKGNRAIDEKFYHQGYEETNLQYLTRVKHNLEELKNSAELLINSEINDLPAPEFLKAVANCYRPAVQFDRYNSASEDFMKAVMDQKYNGSKAIGIRTKDTSSYTESEGHGKDFSWWVVWVKYMYKVYTNKDFKLENRMYTKQEIAEMVEQNIIDVVSKKPYFLTETGSPNLRQYEKDSLNYNVALSPYSPYADPNLFESILKMDKNELLKFCKNNGFFVDFLHSQLTDERIAKDFATFPFMLEKGQQKFEREKKTALSSMKTEEKSLQASVKEQETYIAQAKKKIQQLEEDSAKIETL